MKRPLPILLLTCTFLIANASAGEAPPNEPEIDIFKNAKTAIPISLTGYSGEVDHVLRFDLTVAGFKVVSSEESTYAVAGSNADAVQGQVSQRATREIVLSNRRYAGGSLRAQAHHFSDDIVYAITHRPGIAQTRIAFRGEKGGTTEIYVADYDGANAVAVTSDRALVAAPCWVPGHFALFYTSYKSGFADVYSQELASGQRRAVAKYPGLNTSAAVSPDGQHVALILSKNGSPDLYVCDADGTHPRQLTKTREDESSPCWSPDGKRLCFCSRMGGSPALYTISSDGSNLHRLRTTGAGSSLTEPDWSPDGKYVVFTAIRARGFDLCMVPSEGGAFIPLTAGSDPSWAPNSRTLIFTREVGGHQRLSLLDVVTKQIKDVAQNLGNCSQPSWAR